MKKVQINTDKIYLEIAKKGVSVTDFASSIGMSKCTLFNALNRDETTLKSVVKIAKGLNVEVEDLFNNTAATARETK